MQYVEERETNLPHDPPELQKILYTKAAVSEAQQAGE
jgi:hypothetical protein